MGNLGTATGYPQLAEITSPIIWSGKILVKYYDATVLAAISNTDYEGEISKFGCKVKIRTTPDIAVKRYKKGMKLVHQHPEPTIVELAIDQGDYWDFITDDVDKLQSDYNYMEDWTRDASEQLKIETDTIVLGQIPGDEATENSGATAGKKSASFNMGTTGSPVSIDKTNVLDYIVDAGTILDEQSVPEENRWMVIPPWISGMIKKSDLKDASLSGDGTSIMRNGRLGTIDRFTLYKSNLLNVVTDGSDRVTDIMFGHKSAVTFAAQMLESETLRGESTFGTIVRGLHVYGFKTIKKEGLGRIYAKKG